MSNFNEELAKAFRLHERANVIRKLRAACEAAEELIDSLSDENEELRDNHDG